MKYFAAILIIAMTLCSCSSTIQMNSDSKYIPMLKNRDAEIHLKSGKTINGRQIRFDKGFVFCMNQENSDSLRIPAGDINSISFKDRLGGAVEGLFWGAGTGAGVGFAASTGFKKGGGDKLGSSFFVIPGGVIGGLTGLIIGSVRGHRYTFVLPGDSLKTAR